MKRLQDVGYIFLIGILAMLAIGIGVVAWAYFAAFAVDYLAGR